jgi:hypothetical protein
MNTAVHYAVSADNYRPACKLKSRNPITTSDPKGVSCKACLKTAAYLRAVKNASS